MDTTLALDLEFVRAQFPALQTPWALFDNAGGSVPSRHTIQRMTDYMSRHAVQLGASYDLSVAAGAAVDEGRAVAAGLLGADVNETVLGPSSTSLASRLAQSLAAGWSEGDEVVVTNLDHETNIGPWRRLEERGIRVREWRFRPETMGLELEDLEPLLNSKTRLVAFTHCSNIVGQIHDVSTVAARIREAGALSCVDGVAYAPHRRVDVKALGVDFYIASLYKVFGPHVGALYGRRSALLEGRNVNHFFVDEDQVPYKFEPGGVVHEAVAGVAGIGDYLAGVARHHGVDDPFEPMAAAEARLGAPLLSFLDSSPKVTLLGSADPDPNTRVPTIAFTVEGRDASEIPAALDKEKLAVRYGHFYAHRAVEALGLHQRGGVVRASLLHYNEPQEVERLIEALDRLI